MGFNERCSLERFAERISLLQIVHRLFQDWQRMGVFEEIFHVLSLERSKTGDKDSGISFIDGTFVPSKKGARSLAEVTKAKAAQSWPSAMALVGLLDLAYTGPTTTKLNA